MSRCQGVNNYPARRTDSNTAKYPQKTPGALFAPTAGTNAGNSSGAGIAPADWTIYLS
jgi:hypothetical protein